MPEDTQDPSAQPETAAQDAPPPAPEAGPPNQVDVADAGTLKKKVTVTIPRAKIDAKFDEMFGELRTSAQVPGFRIGHAPRRLIEKRFGKEVSQDVRNALIGESIGQAVEQSKLKTLGEPDLDLDKIALPDSGDMSFSFQVEVMPEFDMPELKGIAVRRRAVEITDDRVEGYLDQLRATRASFEHTDGPAREGDVVVAGAKIAGDGIEPVERLGLTLRVAPGQIEGLPIVELGRSLAGKKAGDSAEIPMTVPQAHPNEAWRDKKVTVTVTVSQVRKRILPKLDDAFASAAGFESIREMRQFVADRLKSRLAAEMQRAMREQVCEYLLDHTSFDLPEGLVARHTARVLRRRYVDLLYQGMSREQIDERITELQAAAAEEARRDLKLSLILGRIAEERKIEVGDDEVNARIAQMAAMQNRRPERLRQELAQDGSLEQVQASLQEEKVLDSLLEAASITEAEEEPEKKEKKEKKPAKAEPKAKQKVEKPAEEKKAPAKKKAAAKTEKKAEKPQKKAAKKSGKKPKKD